MVLGLEMTECGTKALMTGKSELSEVGGLLISKLEMKCRNELTLQLSRTSKSSS